MRTVKLPVHLAFIMDGNGRWATRRLRPRAFGHKAGVQNMFRICGHAFHLGVRIVTVFALSAENLSRPQEELDELFELFRTFFDKKKEKLLELGAKVHVIGDLAALPADVAACMRALEEETSHITERLLNICVNYGARQDVLQAVNRAVALGRFVDDTSFHGLLLTAGVPDPDLIIRTGNEMRLSNFLLYQAAYAELYFSSRMWPEFSRRDLEKALVDYSSRSRRFGGLRAKEQE